MAEEKKVLLAFFVGRMAPLFMGAPFLGGIASAEDKANRRATAARYIRVWDGYQRAGIAVECVPLFPAVSQGTGFSGWFWVVPGRLSE